MTATAQLRIETTDRAAMLRFYLALGGVEQSRTERWTVLQLAGLSMTLVQTDASRGARPTTTDDRIELVVRVPDLAGTLAALIAAGGQLGGVETVQTERLVRDPDGHHVRLMATGPYATEVTDSSDAGAITQHEEAIEASPPTAPPTAAAAPAEQSPPGPAVTGAPVTVSPAPPVPADSGFPQSSLPAGYYTDNGVPTFDAVADRITQRSAAADGHAVLDSESERGAAEADGMEKLKKAGKDRLDQLRKSMGL